MSFIKRYIGDLYVSKRWYLLTGACVIMLFTSFFVPRTFGLATWIVNLLLGTTLIDYILLFVRGGLTVKGGIKGNRVLANRFSIGDENEITVSVANGYPFTIHVRIVDELPEQFQERHFSLKVTVPYKTRQTVTHKLRPVSRGEYKFGRLLCYVSSPLRLLQRRFEAAPPATVKVYPSFMQLRRYQLLATSGSTLSGVKKMRRLGHSLEFEKIKDYVQGDDVRTINWKATARSSNLMVNMYTDARQQQVYCLIDKGRNMKMPFDGLTLLDHSINSVLALLNVALLKQDKAGLITFANKVNDILPADKRGNQLAMILETLYKQQTDYKETNYEAVWNTVYHSITQRSLLLLFTNFETYSSLERQLPFLKMLAHRHLVCVIFFENTLLKQIHENTPNTLEGIYIKTIADQFALEKRLIVKELRRHGVLSVLTTPQGLTIDVINKYLELKARQMV